MGIVLVISLILFMALIFYAGIKIIQIIYDTFLTSKSILKKPKNYYIENHKQKMFDDLKYEEYEDFCKKNGELPISKKGFVEYRKADNDFLKSVNKYIK